MIILAIETSCDDTGIAVIKKEKGKMFRLAGAVSSQVEIHKKWGGVYPSAAKREHQKTLVPLLKEVLKEANLLEREKTKDIPQLSTVLSREKELLKSSEEFFKNYKIKKIDAVAVTVGPGLEPCLFAGVNFARAIAATCNAPLIPINHIKAHILTFLLENKKISFPAVALIASGGHTELVLMKDMENYKLLGKTRDDAAGECFDKTARILGLGYPGGPAIAEQARLWKKQDTRNKIQNIELPRPMMHSKNYDFSFSGLKTAVLYDFLSRDKKTQKDKRYLREMAREIEESITDILIFKLKRAVEEFGARTAILGGGVTANKRLQEKTKKMGEEFDRVDVILPPSGLSVDNAEMIGAAATVEKERRTPQTIKVDANLRIYDRII